jgi:hypothetical protein
VSLGAYVVLQALMLTGVLNLYWQQILQYGFVVAISALGFVACFGPWAAYLIVPLAIHLGGCVGDGFAILRALREPSTTTCEDLRDGIRFHRMGAAAPAHREP